MFEGKVGAALKFLENNVDSSVLHSTDEVAGKLKLLHPDPSKVLPQTLLVGPLPQPTPAMFHSIDEQQILKAASRTNGSGGPSMMDSKQWKRILCSKQYKNEGKELREQLAKFAIKIATEIVDPMTLGVYVACRLIPLNKNPGEAETQIRPIGVGEVLRRIVGKTISWSLKEDIQDSAGPLQMSTGLRGGAEAAIHAMKNIYEEETTDAIILVDAANAFNRLNRLVALHNIQYLSNAFSTVLINTYRHPARLFIVGGGEILSNEGTTQGDTLAMAFYGIGTNPILRKLSQQVPEVYQVWLADDATGAGRLGDLKKWWDLVSTEGLKYGYFVKPSKSWLVLKRPSMLEEATALFASSPINITTEGKRHLGAVIGTSDFKTEYMEEKVKGWCERLERLSDVAKSQPHAAYSAFIHGEQHRYTYFLRTIPGISTCLQPLDDILNDKFIPALFGRNVTAAEREVISMPIKEGGLSIRVVSENADAAYTSSKKITEPLMNSIISQSTELPNIADETNAKTTTIAQQKIQGKRRTEDIKNRQTPELRRSLDQVSEPGASSWLGALPIETQGFNLNKGELQDALCLRYGMPLKNLPSKCPCGAPFNPTHAMNCHKGGFVNVRHDKIRNMECKLLATICHDVQQEPPLQVVENKQNYQASANVSDEARLDIRARGFWREGQNAFFDVRVTNLNCNSQINNNTKSVLRKHETEKKRQYNRRVMEVEHGTFTPLIFTTGGVMSQECSLYHKGLAEKLSKKKGEKYEDVMRYLRIKLSFLALKSTLLCMRGSRTWTSSIVEDQLGDFTLALNEIGV